MNLDDIFKCGDIRYGFRRFDYLNDAYRINLFVGRNWSEPGSVNLSLNDYTHFGIRISDCVKELNFKSMHDLFGFDFCKFDRSGWHPGWGAMIPKAYLIKILNRIGIKDMPEDAGDGE